MRGDGNDAWVFIPQSLIVSIPSSPSSLCSLLVYHTSSSLCRLLLQFGLRPSTILTCKVGLSFGPSAVAVNALCSTRISSSPLQLEQLVSFVVSKMMLGGLLCRAYLTVYVTTNVSCFEMYISISFLMSATLCLQSYHGNQTYIDITFTYDIFTATLTSYSFRSLSHNPLSA